MPYKRARAKQIFVFFHTQFRYRVTRLRVSATWIEIRFLVNHRFKISGCAYIWLASYNVDCDGVIQVVSVFASPPFFFMNKNLANWCDSRSVILAPCTSRLWVVGHKKNYWRCVCLEKRGREDRQKLTVFNDLRYILHTGSIYGPVQQPVDEAGNLEKTSLWRTRVTKLERFNEEKKIAVQCSTRGIVETIWWRLFYHYYVLFNDFEVHFFEEARVLLWIQWRDSKFRFGNIRLY